MMWVWISSLDVIEISDIQNEATQFQSTVHVERLSRMLSQRIAPRETNTVTSNPKVKRRNFWMGP